MTKKNGAQCKLEFQTGFLNQNSLVIISEQYYNFDDVINVIREHNKNEIANNSLGDWQSYDSMNRRGFGWTYEGLNTSPYKSLNICSYRYIIINVLDAVTPKNYTYRYSLLSTSISIRQKAAEQLKYL